MKKEIISHKDTKAQSLFPSTKKRISATDKHGLRQLTMSNEQLTIPNHTKKNKNSDKK